MTPGSPVWSDRPMMDERAAAYVFLMGLSLGTLLGYLLSTAMTWAFR